MRRIWWAKPFYFISILPGFRELFDAGYRLFADNRYRISRSCGLPNAAAGSPSHRSDQQPKSTSR
jgi:predicted DCC family thiol-disulfide oxidoreductase YuxK